MSKLNEEILDAWIQLTTVVDNDRIVSEIPLNEALICRILYQNHSSKITATDLCVMTKIQKSQMNRTLTSMEEKGWIIRERSKEDKRQIFISLDEGKNSPYQKQHEKVLKFVDKLIARMGEDKILQAISIFHEITEIATEEL